MDRWDGIWRDRLTAILNPVILVFVVWDLRFPRLLCRLWPLWSEEEKVFSFYTWFFFSNSWGGVNWVYLVRRPLTGLLYQPPNDRKVRSIWWNENTRWRSWLRHYATSRQVAGSIP
jgi:hypothetical protein